jgi:HAD superfamily hydrolase (TIGR01509 family)
MRAILFDLDGTLLDVDTGRFMDRYFAAVGALRIPGHDGDVIGPLTAGTRAMLGEHPGVTNAETFWSAFEQVSGGPRSLYEPGFEEFYTNVFPTLREEAGPRPGGREAVEAALESGLSVAIATNPMFPRLAIDQRVAWAGLSDLIDRLAVTSYETSTACKPWPTYFLEVAARLGVEPGECVMVGDDADLDLPASAVGMRTFYVGPDRKASGDMRGDLFDVAAMIGRL